MPKPLVVGQISLSFHVATATVVCELLESLGHEIIIKEAPHEDLYEMLGNGEIDLLVSSWLPASHQKYIVPFEDQLSKHAVIYHPYCIWGISERAPSHIQSVVDLAKPEVARLFRKRIQGINPGAGISRFSRQMIDQYELKHQGFYFENGSLEDCVNAYIDAEKSGEFAVIPLWHPQWLHQDYALRELYDPIGLLGGKDSATLLLRKDAHHKINTGGFRLIDNMTIGNTEVSKLDHSITNGDASPRDVARAWISRHNESVSDWIDEPKAMYSNSSASSE